MTKPQAMIDTDEKAQIIDKLIESLDDNLTEVIRLILITLTHLLLTTLT